MNKKKGGNDDYIDRTEFRLLCSYLLRYFELYNMFDEIDESDDDRITYEVGCATTYSYSHIDDVTVGALFSGVREQSGPAERVGHSGERPEEAVC